MRGPLFAILLSLGVAGMGTGAPPASASLRVRPLSPSPDAARASRLGPGPRATMSPDEMRAQAARLERWRSVHDVMTRQGLNWSSSASRRRGWRAPAGAGSARDPNRAATAAPAPARATVGPDIVRVAFIRVDFARDRGGAKSSGSGKFNLTAGDTIDNPVDRPPHNRSFYASHLEALSRYYMAQSYGRVQIQGDVWPSDENTAYTVSDMADFGPWAFSRNIYGAAVRMLRTFTFAADSQSIVRGDPIPWDQYDRVCFIHAGSDLQDDLRQDSKEDIPTFTIGVGDTDRVFFKTGTLDTTGQGCDPMDPDAPCFSLDRAVFFPETINQDGYYGTLNGVIAHECGHLIFGFDDLYNIETGLPVVGEWSLMDSGNLVGSRVLLADQSVIFATGLLPPSVDPWQRFLVGTALNFFEVSLGDTMALLDSERHPDMRRVSLSSDEYLLLENRYLLPDSIVVIQTDPINHVILGPQPDSLLYDALVPGPGVLVWHIDTSVMPFTTSLRINSDYGFNTNPLRPAISIIEADGLADIGDPGSGGILGWPSDPWFKRNNAVLSDTTIPNLLPHIGTRPHVRLSFLDNPDSVMTISATRTWQLPGWPRRAQFPPGGPRLLAVDADGVRGLEVCWAGGADSIYNASGVGFPNPDSSSLFAMHVDGTPVNPLSFGFANLDQISMVQRQRPEGRPRPLMAALALNDPGGGLGPAPGPCWFAVSTYPHGPDTTFSGGRVWLVDTLGEALPGWPALLPSVVTTPPIILGLYPNAVIFVGCADGRVYPLGLDGLPYAGLVPQGPLPGGVSGRLAVSGSVPGAGLLDAWVAAGGANGDVGALHFMAGPSPGARAQGASSPPVWVHRVGGAGFSPDFLWIDFEGATPASGRPSACAAGDPTLVVHHADRLWAFCRAGDPLPGWGRSAGDTLVAGLAAGDLDGDGFPEVITHTVHSKLAYWNVTGAPSPGWPRAGTREDLRTQSPPLVLDLTGNGRSHLVGLNGSGVIAAFDGEGRIPPGWPLASGAGAAGDVVAADLDLDGTLDIVAPDRFGLLWAYSLPVSSGNPLATSWTMTGGDPGRTSSLPVGRSTSAPAPAPGPLVAGSLKAYPNPARRSPVSFAYQLTEPAEVDFRILDTSGHEVASFSRAGIQADNLVVWDPGHLPAGLYIAQLRFHGSRGERRENLPVAVLR